MENIETPLTWGLGVLAIVLIVLSSLNTTSTDYNISNVNSDVNDGFNLNHDHQKQEATVYNIGVWGEKTCSESSNEEAPADSAGVIIFEEGDQKIIMVADEDNSEE
jgi:hypothetical protein